MYRIIKSFPDPIKLYNLGHTKTKDCEILQVENESPSFRWDPSAAFLQESISR